MLFINIPLPQAHKTHILLLLLLHYTLLCLHASEREKEMNMKSGNGEQGEEELVEEAVEDEEEEVELPGFRFHPTDEELVGFYLRRKVEKKQLSIEIIKEIDIYKYDPWDLQRKYIYIVAST